MEFALRFIQLNSMYVPINIYLGHSNYTPLIPYPTHGVYVSSVKYELRRLEAFKVGRRISACNIGE